MIGPSSDKSSCARELAADIRQRPRAVENVDTRNKSISRTRKEKCQTRRPLCQDCRFQAAFGTPFGRSRFSSMPIRPLNEASWRPSRLTNLTAARQRCQTSWRCDGWLDCSGLVPRREDHRTIAKSKSPASLASVPILRRRTVCRWRRTQRPPCETSSHHNTIVSLRRRPLSTLAAVGIPKVSYFNRARPALDGSPLSHRYLEVTPPTLQRHIAPCRFQDHHKVRCCYGDFPWTLSPSSIVFFGRLPTETRKAAETRLHKPVLPTTTRSDRKSEPRFRALTARAWFARENPGMPPLPLSYNEREEYKGRGALHYIVSVYARSLKAQNYDVGRHPSFERYACGVLASPLAPGFITQDEELRGRFPPCPLDGLGSGLYWDPPKSPAQTRR